MIHNNDNNQDLNSQDGNVKYIISHEQSIAKQCNDCNDPAGTSPNRYADVSNSGSVVIDNTYTATPDNHPEGEIMLNPDIGE